MLNKKAGAGTIIEDSFGFLAAIFIMIILFILIFLIHKGGMTINEQNIATSTVQEKILCSLNSLSREKKQDNLFPDLIRIQNEETKLELANRISKNNYNKYCPVFSREFYSFIIYPNSLEKCNNLKENAFCFFVPSREPIGIKSEIEYCGGPTVRA